jgi:hypothetical protein
MEDSFIKKIGGLLFLLTKTKKDCEWIADELDDGNLRIAFDGLSSESSQYASEIIVQLKTLGIPGEACHFPNRNELQGDLYIGVPEAERNEVEIISIKIENILISAYQSLMEELISFPELKNLLSLHLNSLKVAFLKLRSFNTSRLNISS